jgi:hypothetical protein
MPDLEKTVAIRLRAIKVAFGINSHKELGDACGASESVVGNWMVGVSLPRVPEMSHLCDRTGVTLDWIYRGIVTAMDPKLTNGLANIIDGKAPKPSADRFSLATRI